MTPRAEFVLLATLAGGLLSVLGFLLVLGYLSGSAPGADEMRSALLWSPGGVLAGFAASWIASGWHRRAVGNGRRWGAAGLALRTTVLAVLVYPLAIGAWLLFTAWLDQRFAAAGMPLREFVNWLPSMVLVASVSALVVGALPAFAIVFALGRRYLRRSGGPVAGIA